MEFYFRESHVKWQMCQKESKNVESALLVLDCALVHLYYTKNLRSRCPAQSHHYTTPSPLSPPASSISNSSDNGTQSDNGCCSKDNNSSNNDNNNR